MSLSPSCQLTFTTDINVLVVRLYPRMICMDVCFVQAYAYPFGGSWVLPKLQKGALAHTTSYFQMNIRSAVSQLVERHTGVRRDASSRLNDVTVLCPWARHFICCLVMVQPRKTGNRTYITKIVD